MVKWHYVVITHTDLDGIVAAAVYLRLAGAKLGVDAVVHFAEPYKLHKVLSQIDAYNTTRVAIMDLGPNTTNFGDVAEKLRELIRRDVVVEWYDHHRWYDEWINQLKDIGVHLYIDTSTCAAGVVAKYAVEELEAQSDEHIKELVAATCAADLWRWDNPLATKLYRVVDRYKGRKGDAWKRKLVIGFSEGSLWWPELDEALEEYLKLEFEGFTKALRSVIVGDKAGCRFVVVLKHPGPPAASIIGNSLVDRYGADFVVIVRRGGSKGISLRSKVVNVREIAVKLGGGGHPRAAGAPLNMPWWARLIARIYPRYKLAYAAKLIEKVLGEIGCPRLSD